MTPNPGGRFAEVRGAELTTAGACQTGTPKPGGAPVIPDATTEAAVLTFAPPIGGATLGLFGASPSGGVPDDLEDVLLADDMASWETL